MAQVRLYDLHLDIPHQKWSPNTCKTRFALNLKVNQKEGTVRRPIASYCAIFISRAYPMRLNG